jgi:ribosomal protein RSM22 (predicted rRNA methylase)
MNAEELQIYDESFGRRIAWKAQQVLSELKNKSYPGDFKNIVDYGCGTGILTQEYLNIFPIDTSIKIYLVDHSPLASQYAKEKLSKLWPQHEYICEKPSQYENDLILSSHILNELRESDLSFLIRLIENSNAYIGLESGAFLNSKKLAFIREKLKTRFNIWGPCPHNLTCPLLNSTQDWCHNFAQIPQEAFHSSYWEEFSQKLKIDRHRLPYSYLALHKTVEAPRTQARVLGEARIYKAWAKVWLCKKEGDASEVTIEKRTNPSLFKQLKKHPSRASQIDQNIVDDKA